MILVCLLSYKRPQYLRLTLSSFISKNKSLFSSHLRMIALDQCSSSATIDVFSEFRQQITTVYSVSKNFGIGWGFSQLIELSKQYPADYLLFLEDDWECKESLSPYIDDILLLFETFPTTGSLRLRSIHDPVRTVNTVTDLPISTTPWRKNFLIGNYHYVFNPHVVRAPVAEKIIPVSGEYHAMQKYEALHLQNAQLKERMFVHIGEDRAPNRLSRLDTPMPVIPYHQIPLTGDWLVPLPVGDHNE